MISYDDRPEVRALYPPDYWHTVTLRWRYCGRYALSSQRRAEGTREKKVMGDELLIMNY